MQNPPPLLPRHSSQPFRLGIVVHYEAGKTNNAHAMK